MNNDFKNDDIRDLIIERDGYLEQVKELEQELQRKDNIINELKKIIDYYGTDKEHNDNVVVRHILKEMLDKIKELEEK